MIKFFREARFLRFRQEKSLTLMNLTQLGAIVNDNIYKLTMVFLLIDTLGKSQASSILSKAGAIFVLPFLLFSSAAGILADRFSKKWILTGMKVVETCILLCAIVVFLFKSSFGCFTLLFLLGTHSAVFGPAKYGIIPELVDKESVPKANGIITSTTYFGIILGTFLGSFLSQITGSRYTLVMVICVILAILGLFCALSIKKTPKQGSTKKFSPFFFVEVYHTIQYCKQYRHLRLTILASAFFLFIGAFTQLAIIPYTIQALDLPEVYGGYLFLCTALGIAAGAFISGRILKRNINLFIPVASGFALFLLLEGIFIFSSNLGLVIVLLCLLGVAGGLFIVPLDSYIQLTCAAERRGQVIGANNFLGFCGVLVASFCLYFFSEVLSLTSAQGFGVIGFLTLLFSIFFCFRLSDFVVQFLAKIFARDELTLRNGSLFTEAKNPPIVILQNGNWKKFFIFSRIAPEYHFILFEKTRFLYRLLAKLCYHLHLAPAVPGDLLKKAESLQSLGNPICIILPHVVPFEEEGKRIFQKAHRIYVDIRLPLSPNAPAEVVFSED